MAQRPWRSSRKSWKRPVHTTSHSTPSTGARCMICILVCATARRPASSIELPPRKCRMLTPFSQPSRLTSMKRSAEPWNQVAIIQPSSCHAVRKASQSPRSRHIAQFSMTSRMRSFCVISSVMANGPAAPLAPAAREARPRRRADRRGALILVAEIDAAFGQVVGRHLHRDAVAGEDADAILLHLPGAVGERLMAVVEPHAEARVGKQFDHRAVELDQIFLGHRKLLIVDTGNRCSELPHQNKLRRLNCNSLPGTLRTAAHYRTASAASACSAAWRPLR